MCPTRITDRSLLKQWTSSEVNFNNNNILVLTPGVNVCSGTASETIKSWHASIGSFCNTIYSSINYHCDKKQTRLAQYSSSWRMTSYSGLWRKIMQDLGARVCSVFNDGFSYQKQRIFMEVKQFFRRSFPWSSARLKLRIASARRWL